MLKRYISLAVGAAALLAISAVAVADRDGSTPPSQGLERVSAVEPAAAGSLAVLRASRDAADALPAAVAARMQANAPFGMNPSLSRRAIGNATHSVFLIPARGHVCVSLTVGEGANLTCPSTDHVVAGGGSAATVTVESGDIAIYGLVPDGVDSVEVETGASTSTTVATTDNAYYTVVPRGTPLRAVRYTGSGGERVDRIYDPAEVLGG